MFGALWIIVASLKNLNNKLEFYIISFILGFSRNNYVRKIDY